MDEIVDYTKQIVDIAVSFQYEDLYPDEQPLGKCPLCSRPVFERSWFYRCLEFPADRGDRLPLPHLKDKSGRYMDRQTVRILLEKGETEELEGFAARDGAPTTRGSRSRTVTSSSTAWPAARASA